MVRSCLATIYQLGFDFQAVPPTFASKRSGFGAPWVAQTSFCSCSERSPQKYLVPSGRSQIRPSTIIGSGAGNDASAVGVADEDNGVADPADCCFRQGNVLRRCVKAVLRRNTFIPLRLKGKD